MITDLSSRPDSRTELEFKYGQVWDTHELCADFNVQSFLAPFVLVARKEDGVRGTLVFQTRPRFYFDFTPTGGITC